MSYKTIRVSYDNWLELMGLKAELGLRDFDEVIRFLIKEYAESLLTEMQQTLNDEHVPRGKLIPYPGGDYFIADEIIKLLKASNAITLVEVFGGSGHISTVAKAEGFKVVIYNDIDSLLVSFFKCLKERPRELLKALSYLPFSREIRDGFKDVVNSQDELDELTKAVAAFYIHNTTMFGCGGFAVSKSRNIAEAFASKLKKLYEFAGLWRNVVIEKRDFREIFDLYDSDKTVFYCDPPFFSSDTTDRSYYYKYGFSEKDFKDLLDKLSKIRGKFVLKIPHDHLKIDFINEWVKNYKIREVDHFLSMDKKINEEKRRTVTILVYNF